MPFVLPDGLLDDFFVRVPASNAFVTGIRTSTILFLPASDLPVFFNNFKARFYTAVTSLFPVLACFGRIQIPLECGCCATLHFLNVQSPVFRLGVGRNDCRKMTQPTGFVCSIDLSPIIFRDFKGLQGTMSRFSGTPGI